MSEEVTKIPAKPKDEPRIFPPTKTEAHRQHYARVLNPIAKRAAIVGLDAAIAERLVSRLTADQRLAMRKLAAIFQSTEPKDVTHALISSGIGDAGLQLVTAVLAQELGWKGEIIQ